MIRLTVRYGAVAVLIPVVVRNLSKGSVRNAVNGLVRNGCGTEFCYERDGETYITKFVNIYAYVTKYINK